MKDNLKFFIIFLILISLFFVCIDESSAENNDTTEILDNDMQNNYSNNTLAIIVTSEKVVTYVKPILISDYAIKKKPTKLSQSSICIASKYVDHHMYKYGKLSNSVKISGYKYSIPEFLF